MQLIRKQEMEESAGSAEKQMVSLEEALKVLHKKKLVDDYPPLVENQGVRVAQFEHTIFIGENGPEVMTRLPE